MDERDHPKKHFTGSKYIERQAEIRNLYNM